MLHVPYQGTAQALSAVLSGDVSMTPLRRYGDKKGKR